MIKTFENFNNNEMVDTVKDICLELEDEGFDVRHNWINETTIMKGTGAKHVLFDYNEVKEVIDRLREYLGDRLISISASNGSGWVNIRRLQLGSGGDPVMSALKISYSL